MSDHFPVTTAARNMLLLAKWAPTTAKLTRFGQIPWSWKTARCKNHHTHSGGEMWTPSRWSEILVAITVQDVELTPEIFLTDKSPGLRGYFIFQIWARSCRDFRCRGKSVPEVFLPVSWAVSMCRVSPTAHLEADCNCRVLHTIRKSPVPVKLGFHLRQETLWLEASSTHPLISNYLSSFT